MTFQKHLYDIILYMSYNKWVAGLNLHSIYFQIDWKWLFVHIEKQERSCNKRNTDNEDRKKINNQQIRNSELRQSPVSASDQSIFYVIFSPGYSASRHSRCFVQSLHDCPCGKTCCQGSLTQLRRVVNRYLWAQWWERLPSIRLPSVWCGFDSGQCQY